MSHLFLSPHFDDAVLSCGATIHHLVGKGESVAIRTVMAGIPQKLPDTPIIRDLHQRWQSGDDPVRVRVQEDEVAVRHLGATSDRMVSWLDCVYRISRAGIPLYPDHPSIFGEIHPQDTTAQLLPTIVLPPQEIPRCIYAPLGAGHHIDHQIVRNWAITLKQYMPWVALKFYEEYPYTEDSSAVDKALAFFHENFPRLRLELETVPVDENNVKAKLESIACYKSQVSSFWADNGAMEAVTRQALIVAGGGEHPGERYWIASAS